MSKASPKVDCAKELKFKLVKDIKKDKQPRCPGCWGGRLYYWKDSKVWICCKQGGGWMWCLREYKGVRK